MCVILDRGRGSQGDALGLLIITAIPLAHLTLRIYSYLGEAIALDWSLSSRAEGIMEAHHWLRCGSSIITTSNIRILVHSAWVTHTQGITSSHTRARCHIWHGDGLVPIYRAVQFVFAFAGLYQLVALFQFDSFLKLDCV